MFWRTNVFASGVIEYVERAPSWTFPIADEWISLLHVGEQYEIIGQLVSSRDNLCGVMMECFHIEALPSLNQRRSLGQDIQLPHAVLEYIRSR